MRNEPREQQESPTDLLRRIDEAKAILGQERALPDSMTQQDMEAALHELQDDAHFADFQEFLLYNRVLSRMGALQREREFSETQGRREELIVVNQAETYFAYLSDVLAHTLAISDKYLALRRSVSAVPTVIQEQERELESFVTSLSSLMQQRRDFSNASLAIHQLSTQRDRQGNVSIDQEALTAQLEILMAGMDAAGKAALQVQDRQVIQIHASGIDQRLIELLGTNGHLPAQLLLSLQLERYRILLEEQKSIVRSGGHVAQRTKISAERHDVSDAMIVTADDLSGYHEKSHELLILQSQFQTEDVRASATTANPLETPEPIREKIDEVTQERASFHRERLRLFVDRFEEDVLSVGLPELAADFSDKAGREFTRTVSNMMASVYTLPVPESFGIRDHVREQLAGPLNEAMGWPPEKMDLPFDQLDQDERDEVMRRMRSIADAIRTFDDTKIDRVRNALQILESLPPATQTLGQAPQSLPDLAPGALTAETISQYDLPTAYLLALRELHEAMGDPSTGFIGEVQKFTDAVNATIDINLDLADALQSQHDAWMKLAAVIAITAVGTLAARKLLPKLFSGAARVTRATGTQAARGVRAGVDGFRSASRIARSSEAVNRVPKSTVARRVLGPIGIVLVGAELRSVLQRDNRLEALPELDAIDAAIELMEKKGNRLAIRYTTELSYLKDRREAFRMQQNALQLVVELGKRYPDDSNKEANALKDRCEEIEKFARAQKIENEKLFPITDYLMTDSERDEGNVGVNIRDIDQARLRGMRHEIDRGKKIDFSSFGTRLNDFKNPLQAVDALAKPRVSDPQHNLADLTAAHDALLEDAAEVLGR